VSQKSLNDEERGGNCLLAPERSYGPAIMTRCNLSVTDFGAPANGRLQPEW